jgi:hypothetical protein
VGGFEVGVYRRCYSLAVEGRPLDGGGPTVVMSYEWGGDVTGRRRPRVEEDTRLDGVGGGGVREASPVVETAANLGGGRFSGGGSCWGRGGWQRGGGGGCEDDRVLAEAGAAADCRSGGGSCQR